MFAFEVRTQLIVQKLIQDLLSESGYGAFFSGGGVAAARCRPVCHGVFSFRSDGILFGRARFADTICEYSTITNLLHFL